MNDEHARWGMFTAWPHRVHTPRVLMGLLFFPRGGSAHVARNLAHALPRAGWDATVLTGSVTRRGHFGDARALLPRRSTSARST